MVDLFEIRSVCWCYVFIVRSVVVVSHARVGGSGGRVDAANTSHKAPTLVTILGFESGHTTPRVD